MIYKAGTLHPLDPGHRPKPRSFGLTSPRHSVGILVSHLFLRYSGRGYIRAGRKICTPSFDELMIQK